MKNKEGCICNEKPYAGNPHVRLDADDAFESVPRSVSLCCKNLVKLAFPLAAMAITLMSRANTVVTDDLESLMRENRPRLPHKETRSLREKEQASLLRNADPFEASTSIASRILGGLPESASWRTSFRTEEERIDVCEFVSDDGTSNNFAVYGQLGNFTPYYWTANGLPSGGGFPSKDFLEQYCRVHSSSSIQCSTGVLSVAEVDVRELGARDVVSIPYSRFWFFFVNDSPGANWAHPCRYIFVSEDLTSFTVLFRMLPPRLFSKATSERIRLRALGNKNVGKTETLENVRSKAYGYAQNLKSLSANSISYTTGNASKSYFVLISGGADPEANGIRFWCDTAMLYSTLTLKYGVSKDNIYVYMSDGTSSAEDANLGDDDNPVLVSSPLDLDGDGKSDIDGAATKSNVSSCFSNLRSRLGSDDQLFVFVTSHGSPDGTAGVNNYGCLAWLFSSNGSDAYFWDEELASWTSGFSCPVAFAIETCYSGGFIDDITATANRVIATACNHYETSYGYGGGGAWDRDVVGSTGAVNCWAVEFTTALRGYQPKSIRYYAYPWQDADAFDADSNGDGLVSFNEARNYAYANDVVRCTRSSHTSTCGKDNRVEHPQYAESTSGLGNGFYVLKQSSGVDPRWQFSLTESTTGADGGCILKKTFDADGGFYDVTISCESSYMGTTLLFLPERSISNSWPDWFSDGISFTDSANACKWRLTVSANDSTQPRYVYVTVSFKELSQRVLIYQEGRTQSTQTVTFNTNGGTSCANREYTIGSTYGSLPTTSKTGYAFDGWYTSSSGGTQITASSTVSSSTTRTLYAHWTANTYTVSYSLNGGTHGTTHPTDETYDTVFYVSAPTKSGHTFAGWTVTSGLNTSTAKWGTTSSPSMSISSTTKCVNGTNGNVYFKNLRSTTGSVTLTANWQCNHSSTTIQNARAATCTVAGYTGDRVCSTCGTVVETGTTIPALGHQEGVGVVTQEPTTTAEGVMTYSCTRCGIVMRTEAIPKIVMQYPDLGFATFSDWNFGCVMFTTTNAVGAEVFNSAPVRLFDCGELFKIAFGYGNFGEVAISNATVVTRIELISETDDTPSVTSSQNTWTLDPYRGDLIAKWNWSWTNLAAGVYTARVTLDAENVLADTNRANNVSEFVFAIRDPLRLGDALGCVGLALGTNADDWYGTRDGADPTVAYARTKHLGNYGTNVLSATVTDAGTLTFDWKVSSERNFDWLEFLVDGIVTNRISGTNCVWQSQSYDFAEGGHVVEWRYRKDGSYYAGLDCAWLANIEWTPPVTYTVTFDPNGGTGTMEAQIFHEGELQNLSSNVFTQTGFHFVGWAVNPDATEAVWVDGVSFMPTRDMTLYAVWRSNKHAVEFHANGGAGTMQAQTFTWNVAKAISTCTFTREHYTFAGWATNENGSVVYVDQQLIQIDEDLDLWAVWSPETYSVAFNGNGATSGTMAAQSFTYGVAKSLRANAFQKTGHDFKGWATESSGAVVYADGAPFSATVNITLYAVWEVKTYTVTFNGNGATGGLMAAQSFAYGTAQNLNANVFQKTGHDFKGWATVQGGAVVYADGALFSATANVTLYAVWEAKTFMVTFNGNGATSGTMAAQSFTYGVAKSLSANVFQKTGHDFKGWATEQGGAFVYTDGAQFSAKANTTLWAVWEAKTYTVTFSGNGATSESMSAQLFTYGTAQNLTANAYQKTGHDFKGWATTPGGAVAYANSASFSATANVTLYAVWEAKTFTVRFLANDGTGAILGSQQVTYGVEAMLGTPTPEREGYTLAGWSESPNGGVAYRGGESVTFDEDTDLYAVWSAGLGAALAGTESLVWRTGGDAPWTGVPLEGEDVARSGAISNDGSTWVATDVTGPGRLTFRWKVSSESYRDYQIDYLSFSVDDEEMDWIGGEVGWTECAFDLNEGQHTLTWTYFKDEVDFDGEDCAWLDSVFFLHSSGVSFAAPDATSGSVPSAIEGWENDEVMLPAVGDLRRAKHEFAGWTDGIATYSPGGTYILPSAAATLSAVWTAKVVATPEIVTPAHYADERSEVSIICATPGSTIRYTLDGSDPLGTNGVAYNGPFAVAGCPMILAAATLDDWFDSAVATASVSRVWTAPEVLNAPDRFFDLRSDAPWTRDRTVSHDGTASMRSGAIGDGESTAFSTVVYGSGTVSFWWKVSSEIFKNHKIDYLSFMVDGTESAWIGGEKDWTRCSASLSGDGAHTLSWIYSKDSEGSAGDDAGWVDEFVWTPAVSAYIMIDAGDVGKVAVDRAWLEEKFPGVDPSASVAGLAANGKPVWQAYVAGYDPNDPNAGFRATIRIVNGLPVVEPDPDLGDSRTYVIEGKPTLKDDWSEPDAGSRFFRIRVLPPEVSDGGGNASASLAAPIGVTATNDRENGVLVSWQAVSGATSYELWKGESGAPDPSSLVGMCVETSRLDSEAASGIQSRYWVRAIGPSASSPLSSPVEGMKRLSAPQNLKAVSSGDPIVLSWDAVIDATSYEVLRAQIDDISNAEKLGATTDTSYSDDSLSRGVKYWYWVRPMNGAAEGIVSTSASGWRLLEKPTGVTASQGTEAAGVRITWNAVDGAMSYNVLRSTNANDYTKIGATATTSFLDPNPGISGTWFYVVEAVGRDVGAIGYSAYASGYQGIYSPSEVSATQGEDFSAVTITWSAVDGASRYSVWRNTSSSSSSATCINSYQTGTSYRDTTASGGTNYYYWVKSHTSRGAVSDFSARALGYNAEIASIVINGVSTLYGVGASGCYGAMAKTQSGKVLPLPTSATWELVTTGYVNKVTIPSGFADADIISDNKSACFAVTNVPSNTLTLPSGQTINLGNKSTTIKASCTWHGVTKSATKVITMSPADSSSQYSSYIVGTNSAVVLGDYSGTATSVTVPTTFNGGTVKGLDGTFNNTVVASVTIPANIVVISGDTFASCASLSSITVNSSNPSFCSSNGILFNKNMTTLLRYPPKKTGTSYIIPDSVISLNGNSFKGVKNLTSLYVPSTISSFNCIDKSSLLQLYFFGDAPSATFESNVTCVYYLNGTTGWKGKFGGTRPVQSVDIHIGGSPTSVWSNPIKSLAITGSVSVASGSKLSLTGKGTFQSGHSNYACKVTSWQIISGSEYASISSAGVLTAKFVTSPQTVTIKATAAIGGGTATATKKITITP